MTDGLAGSSAIADTVSCDQLPLCSGVHWAPRLVLAYSPAICEANWRPPPTRKRLPSWTTANIGLAGRPALRLVHWPPPSVETHTAPPEKSPLKVAMTWSGFAGLTATPLALSGVDSGGVRLDQLLPPLTERINTVG